MGQKTEKSIKKQNENGLAFIKEVARYFMDFLETDFHKRRTPKRNTIQKTKEGLKVGIDLEKYPKLKKTVFALLNDGFKKQSLQIKKGEYINNVPKTLFNLIKNKIKYISKKDLDNVFQKIQKLAKEKAILYAREYDKFLEETREETKNILSKNIILPFLDDLDKPLENLDLADENSKFQLEIDITDSLFSLFKEKYSEVLQNFFQKQKNFNFQNSLQEIIKLPEIQNNLIRFFENFVIADAFYDIYQLYRNDKHIDKTEIYLYFYELSLGNEKFPVLYIPITVLNEKDGFLFQFEKRIFVNTKAIGFVVQEFNLQVQKKSTLAGEFDRIIYITEENNLFSILENIIKKIENFFELNRNISLQNSEFQKGVNLIVSLSNRSYLYLFDKSDEALINDYEEILNDDGEIIENFSSLLNGFVKENPKPFMEEIDDEWHKQSIPQRLTFESPIPLNDEQKQVLMALYKPDCNYMILEGPPGTGKSHTITAIICKALLEEKSVLVLSDKKEALDVVEGKISETLNKIRHEDDFQNPILRLGRTGNKFYKIVQGQTIQKIREHYYAYKHKKEECDDAREESLKTLEQNIKDNIVYFENINLQDIEFYFNNLDKFSEINWINNEKVSNLKTDFLKIRTIIQKLNKYDNCTFKASFVTEKNLEFIQELHRFFEELENQKSFFQDLKLHEKGIEKLEKLSFEERKNISQTLEKIKNIFNSLKKISSGTEITSLGKITDKISFSDIQEKQSLLIQVAQVFESSKRFFEKNLNNANILENFITPKEITTKEAIKLFNEYLEDLKSLHNPILGYLFKKEKLNNLNRKFKKTFHFFNLENPEKYRDVFLAIYDLFEFIDSKLSDNEKREIIFKDVIKLFIQNNNQMQVGKYNEIKNNLNTISKEIKKVHSIGNLKICNIESQISFTQILNLIENIQSTYSKVKDIKLEIDVSCKHLRSKKLNDEIKYLKKLINSLGKLLSIKSDIDFLVKFQKENSQIAEQISLHINTENLSNLRCRLLDYSEKHILTYLKFKEIGQKLEKQFNNQPEDKFLDSMNEVESLITAQMTYFLDKRIIEYTQYFAGEVNALKNKIKRKEKFPKGLFQNLKKAFPCILAGIRDYAEFIPLEKDLFDLVIIDEASQVSIAQALPALIRGKKIIVLGDDKQFSNVKANNASKVTNQELKKRVQSAFSKEKIDKEDKYGWFTKVKENFDIKNSILKFSRFIRNYECQLKKHFRCYPEIISYSDKYFYDYTLQCMKIRGKRIEEVIKIDVIDHDGKFDETKNTNELEAKHIIKKLKELKENEFEQSIGIITPHREQVTFLFDKINELPERDWLFDSKRKLKIMTFDTCQGEERDYVFYSMVATKEKDRLNWIFLKDFSSISEEIDGTIKSQRMNVGFSRAKECIHFVLSKPIEEFQGEIKNAMLHYKNELEVGKKRIFKKLDSKMEYKIDEIFHNTRFYKENKDKIEFIPQFPLGDYLKQLDPEKKYTRPSYKVDFLLIFENQKIVIEYDGFKEHFVDLEEVNKSNYKYYMKADDIYRQKVLEGYGYKFLRINRFNIGDNPIETLNNRLEDLVKKKSKIMSR